MTFFAKKVDNKKPYFYGVAIATLLSGAAIVALGIVELGFNVFGHSYNFNSPVSKIVGGLVVLSLGYIHLELELMRIAKK